MNRTAPQARPATFSDLLLSHSRIEIARALDVPRSRVYRWIDGRSAPEVKYLPKLAEIFGLPVDELALIIAGESHAAAS